MDLFAFDDLYVRRLKEHDRETEAHFSGYFRSMLFAKLRKRIAPQDVDDVIQKVFVRVLSRLDEVRDGRRFGAFVAGVCNLIVLEGYRSKPTEPLTEAHEEIAGTSDIEREFFKEEAAERVRRVLKRMGKKDAAILRAIFLDEEPREEVCRRFGVSDKYLRVLLHRALEKFKAAYRREK